jgi:hypothetical protein
MVPASSGSGSGTITLIESPDSSVTVTNGSGPTVNLAVAGSAGSVPVVMTQNLALAADTQTLFHVPITIGSYQIVGAAGSVLVGV